MKKTVLDLIPVSEIETWKPGDHVLVIAGTGKCKTTWVKQVLWPYCKKRGLSLYTLANRSMLRDDIQNGTDMPVLTYQKLEHNKYHQAWDADVVVMDECHSLATDVALDCKRNLMLRFFENKNTIIIGLTATPVDCVTEMFSPQRIYTIPRDNSHIESVYTYDDVKQTADILRAEMSRGGRVLCFVHSAYRGCEMHEEIEDTAFICSDSARVCTDQIKAYKKEISRNRHWGDAQALIATKVMDVGVSIEDPEVTSVIVETEDYTVDMIQMIGRIRCQEGQRIRVFVCLFSRELFQRRRDSLQSALNDMDRYQQNPSLFTYIENYFPYILTDGTINTMLYRYVKQRITDIDFILEHGARAAVARQLLGVLILRYNAKAAVIHRPHAKMLKLSNELCEIVKPLLGKEYLDRKELLDHFDGPLQRIRGYLNLPHTRVTRKSINEVLAYFRLPYEIQHKQYTSGTLRGKYYSVLVDHSAS